MFRLFLLCFILNSLPSEHGPFKISYNIHKENGLSMNFWPCVCKKKED